MLRVSAILLFHLAVSFQGLVNFSERYYFELMHTLATF